MAKLLDADALLRMADDYQAGVPIAEIIEKYDISETTFARYREALGLQMRRRGRQTAAPGALEEARRRLHNGKKG